MSKTVLISNKAYGDLEKISKDYCHDSGSAYTSDRYFAIVNETFDYHLKLKSILVYWWMSFWYGTNDYKKRKELANKKYNRSDLFKRLFYWLCVIGLILTLIFGLAIPIITSATTSILLIQGKAQGVIYANGQLIGYVFTNSEAASIIYNLGSTMSTMTSDQLAIINATLNHLNLTPTELQKYVVKIGNSYMIIAMTADLQQVLYAFIQTQKDYLGHLDISNLSWSDLILSTNQAGQAILIPKIWIAYFRKSSVIVPIIFTIFFIAVIYLHERRRKKIIPKINAMSIQDYLTTKILFVNKFKFILNRQLPMVKGIKELNHRFVFASDVLGSSQIYYDIRLMNFLYSTFSDMNCIMVLNVSDDNTIEMLQKICTQDFHQNINLIIIDNDQLAQLKANNAYGYLFEANYLTKLNQEPSQIEIVQDEETFSDLKLKYKEKVNRNYNHRINEELNTLNYKIRQLIFKNRKKLNDKDQKLVIEECIANYNKEKQFLIDRYHIIQESLEGKKEK